MPQLRTKELYVVLWEFSVFGILFNFHPAPLICLRFRVLLLVLLHPTADRPNGIEHVPAGRHEHLANGDAP